MRLWITVLLGACAAAPPSSSSPRASDAVLEEWVGRHTRSSVPSVHVTAAEHRARAARTGATRTRPIASDGRRIDVAFRRAPLSEALRLLADEARLQLVIPDALPGEVNLRLRAVRPYDALLSLAQAHGADVLRNGDLVIVRAR